MNNEIGSTRNAVMVEIGTYGSESGSVTVGDIKISGNEIDGIASGERGIDIDYYVNPGDTSIATIGRTLIQANSRNGGAGERGIHLGVELDIDPGATGAIGLPLVAMNTIDSFVNGVYLDNIDDVSLINNTVTGNTIGIWANVDSFDHTIAQNNLYGNPGAAIVNQAPTLIVAEDNWWGDVSGPYDGDGTTEVPPCTGTPADEINTDGAGDHVPDRVDYCPWATEPFVRAFIFADGFASGGTYGWSSVEP